MLSLKLLPKAITDLENIYEFTLSSWGLKKAENYQDELFEGMLTITQNPKIGSIYFFKEGNYRKININRHLIFYRQSKKEIIVVRVLHDKIDLNIHLK